ncbi:MAG TPA: DUF1203 domain-containing protein [Rhodanobacteraceae bacterium]|nr:DUF1203 domain-containing protein [Rhodanobacteraceae bacterium]
MFQLVGIEHEQFEPLFELSDAELANQGIVRRIADSDSGFPCRVSLEDAAAGDELLLLHYLHHSVSSPYRASGPIYVRRGQTRRVLGPGLVPDYVTRRIISMRAYDSEHMMLSADVLEGSDIARALEHLFTDPAVSYVHLHNARQGCFSCHVRRV